MEPIIQTQIQFIAQAQSEYEQSITKQSPQAVEFWLSQLHRLCQQLYWLRQSAGSPVMVSKSMDGVTAEHMKQLLAKSKPTRVEAIVEEPSKPTSYNWGDGFQGVTLDNGWDDTEE